MDMEVIYYNTILVSPGRRAHLRGNHNDYNNALVPREFFESLIRVWTKYGRLDPGKTRIEIGAGK
jgi:hypothetical protein